MKTDFPFALFPPSFCAAFHRVHPSITRCVAAPWLFLCGAPVFVQVAGYLLFAKPKFFLCLLQTNLTCKTLPFLCAGGFCLLTEELPDSEHPAWCCESTAANQTWKTTRKAKRKHHYCNLNTFLYFQMRFKHIARVFFRVCVFFKVRNSQKKKSNKSCPIRLYLDTDLCSSSLRLFSITPR